MAPTVHSSGPQGCRPVPGPRFSPATAMEAVRPSPRQALIVEDDREFRLYLSDVMAMLPAPWRVEGVTLGREAIAFARAVEGQLDLALVDLGLPDMDGLQVVSSLRRHCPETPILILSVITTEDKVMAALRCGANGYLLKDNDVMEVADAVAQVLQGNHPISPRLAGYLIRANRAGEVLRKMFSLAVVWKMRDDNPAQGFRRRI